MSQSVLLLRSEFMALRMDLAWELVMMSLGAMVISESRDLKLLKESARQSQVSCLYMKDLYVTKLCKKIDREF